MRNQKEEVKKIKALLFVVAFCMALNIKLLMDVSKQKKIIANLAGAGQEYIDILEADLIKCKK